MRSSSVLFALIIYPLFIASSAASRDKCSDKCIKGKTDYFSMPTYGGYSLAYEHSTHTPAVQSPQSTDITRGIIVIHGDERDVNDYYCWMTWALESVGQASSSYVWAPHYFTEKDKVPANTMYWTNAVWEEGGLSSPKMSKRTSSFQVLNDVMQYYFANKTIFPNLNEILVVGHSGGGQTVQRFAVATTIDSQIAAAGIELRYIAENPGSYTYLDGNRPVLPTLTLPTCTACANDLTFTTANFTFAVPSKTSRDACSGWNDWKMGLDNPESWITQSPADMRKNYPNKDVTYLYGTDDNCADLGNCSCDAHGIDVGCAAEMQGWCRFQRGWIYFRYLEFYYGHPVHSIANVPGVGHDGCHMLTSEATLHALFPNSSIRKILHTEL